jgi:hypothetical protein
MFNVDVMLLVCGQFFLHKIFMAIDFGRVVILNETQREK